MIRKLLCLAVLCLVAVIASPAAGQAVPLHSHTTIDPRGDVLKSVGGPDAPHRIAPHQRHGDLRRITFRHSEKTVWIRMRFTELARTGDSFVTTVRMRTNEHVYREVTVTAWAPRYNVGRGWRGGVDVERRDSSLVHCGAAHHIGYRTNTILVRLPRTCLANPRWFSANTVFTAFRYGKNPVVLLDGGNDSPRGLTGWTPRLYH